MALCRAEAEEVESSRVLDGPRKEEGECSKDLDDPGKEDGECSADPLDPRTVTDSGESVCDIVAVCF